MNDDVDDDYDDDADDDDEEEDFQYAGSKWSFQLYNEAANIESTGRQAGWWFLRHQ